MSSALFFLGIALVIAVVGGAIVMIMHRPSSTQSGDGVDQFREFMDALAPDDSVESRRGGPTGGG